jgi:hypothetical protein
MDKDIVPYKQALDLKELGFNRACYERYYNGRLELDYNEWNGFAIEHIVSAPFYQQAFRWFNEKRGLYSNVFKNAGKFEVYIENLGTGSNEITVIEEGALYEEAELECLKKLIEIVKNRKNG